MLAYYLEGDITSPNWFVYFSSVAPSDKDHMSIVVPKGDLFIPPSLVFNKQNLHSQYEDSDPEEVKYFGPHL